MCVLTSCCFHFFFCFYFFFFFFNDTATTEIYTLSLHDALPILFTLEGCGHCEEYLPRLQRALGAAGVRLQDRKSTRLNSSHQIISYAVFCLKKKKKKKKETRNTTHKDDHNLPGTATRIQPNTNE